MSNLFFPDSELPLEVLEPGKVSRKIRARGGSLMMVEVFFSTGGEGYEHRHVHEQTCYCLSGEFIFNIEGKTTTLRAGDSVYIPASALHGTTCVAEGRLLDVFTPQREDFLKS
ncbi:cupin domain-containing protein [Propionivibrio soli]|uniref:cupin domain-containing protein n=1 Tax=Propionivibrio soli TaxID=2976531 RepID=UPI0021E9366C|nr:cupin domain-containing protein [Propionivibrio soli]